MRVYLVTVHNNIDGNHVHSVHQTKESAEMQRQLLEQSDERVKWEHYFVRTFEIQNIKL
jgi:hypothetical protein